MKTLIIALNSKYIHSALAPWYLKAVCEEQSGDIKVMEFTINDRMESVLTSIYTEKADVVAFSCYIWNISQVLRLTEDLRKVSPGTGIILGGPEVSFEAEKIMTSNASIDFIISGEGEIAFKKLLNTLQKGISYFHEVPSLTYRKSGKIVTNTGCGLIENLDGIPSPYTGEMLSLLRNRIVYFESSRGCPFSCSYCISSTFEGVRYFSMDRVRSEIYTLVNAGVRQVKFVDRTFNSHRERAKEIFLFIIQLSEKVQVPNFHFEAAADLFDDEMLDILVKAPSGLIQLEIGVQTTNPVTLEWIHRKTSLDKVFHHVRRLKELGNIHLHLDLIAGLPGENLDSFKKSFNEVYGLKPHQLQLGFLKLLKGSQMRMEAEKHGYFYRAYPPYEVLSNSYLSYDQLLELKDVEEIVERYYNSGRFQKSLAYILENLMGASYEFYHEFARFNREKGYLERPLSSRELYNILMEYVQIFFPDRVLLVGELMKLDYLSSDNTNNLPPGIQRIMEKNFADRCFSFLKRNDNISNHLPEFQGNSAKEIFKSVHFEIFAFDLVGKICDTDLKQVKTVILFNYADKDKVTGLYKYFKVELDS